MQWQRFRHLFILFTLTAGLAAGCGSDDDSNGGGADCPAGQERNALTGQCRPVDDYSLDAGDARSDTPSDDTGWGNDAPPPDDSGGDATPEDGGHQTQDVEQDTSTCPDRDGDGAADQACGGQDCDDTDPTIAPGMAEVCDEHDNDCDGQLNQGLRCSFYAHSSSDLYLVDPFEKTATPVTTVPDLFDMDTHPDGTLYGITFSQLYRFDASTAQWSLVGDLGVNAGTPNGLAINNPGTAFMTSGNEVYTIDLTTGAAAQVGTMNGSYNSSGDCVVNKDNSLYMSSNHSSSGDTLVLIDGTNAQVTQVGAIGFQNVYGLTAAWGRMFGLTGAGKLIEIDTATGQATELHTFSSISWYGAASTPQR